MGLEFNKILAARRPGDRLPELYMAFGFMPPDIVILGANQYDQYVTFIESQQAKNQPPDIELIQLDMGMRHLARVRSDVMSGAIKLEDLSYTNPPPIMAIETILQDLMQKLNPQPGLPLDEALFFDTQFNELSRKAVGVRPATEPGGLWNAEISNLHRLICRMSYCPTGPN